MATILRTNRRTLLIENLTHAIINADHTLLYPLGYFAVPVAGEEGRKAVELMRAASFIGSGRLLINPAHLILAEKDNDAVHLRLNGQSKALLAPASFLDLLEGSNPVPQPEAEEPEQLSSAGNTARSGGRKKKSA